MKIVIDEHELEQIIHQLVGLAKILRTLEIHQITVGQKQILNGCETRLVEIRQQLIEAQRNNSTETNKEEE